MFRFQTQWIFQYFTFKGFCKYLLAAHKKLKHSWVSCQNLTVVGHVLTERLWGKLTASFNHLSQFFSFFSIYLCLTIQVLFLARVKEMADIFESQFPIS